MKLKKGDRVEFTEKGETKYGVVSRGGAGKITVIMDGGEFQVTGHAPIFRKSDKPLAVDTEPSPMDDYGMVGYKEFSSPDGGGFNAFITYKGKKILSAHDGGHGGEVEIHSVKKGSHYWNSPEQVKFQEDAKAWALQFGDKDGFGAVDCWIEWYAHKRPYGVTAKMYWEEFNRELAG